MQQPDDACTRYQVHLRLAQGGQGVPRDPQRVRPLQDGVQVADLRRTPGGPLVQEVARAHGDDDAAVPVGVAGLIQGGDVDELLAHDRP